jgi:hypothetical protein
MGYPKNRLTHIQKPPGLASGELHLGRRGGRGLRRKKRPSRTAADAGRRTAIRTSSFLSSPSFFPSPRIPTDRWAGRRTRRRADERAVGFRKTQFVWVSLKIDSRPHKTAFDPGAVGRLPAVAAGQERAREDDPFAAETPHRRPTRHLPCTHPPCTRPPGGQPGPCQPAPRMVYSTRPVFRLLARMPTS